MQYWSGDRRPIPLYQAATWGPPEAGLLITRDGCVAVDALVVLNKQGEASQ